MIAFGILASWVATAIILTCVAGMFFRLPRWAVKAMDYGILFLYFVYLPTLLEHT